MSLLAVKAPATSSGGDAHAHSHLSAEAAAHRCIHELFAEQAARTPDATALIYGPRSLTYRELNQRANHLARRLRDLGVGHESLVGLLMTRSIEQMVSVLAILKAGAAYVPLDPAYPRERLALMLTDTAAPVVVTQRRLLDRIPTSAAVLLCVDDEPLADVDDGDLPQLATPDSLAYVIYTSGSTGVPKGVLIDHRGLVNHTLAIVVSHGLDAGDRVLQFSSLSFDASASTLFPALVAGACLVLPQLSLAELIGDQLTRLCEEQGVSVVQLPASVWHQWVDDMVARGHTLTAPLKVLLVGGEPPLVEKLRAWIRLTGRSIAFFNAYGPTEAAITTTLFAAYNDEATAATLDMVPIGRPISGKRVYLLDSELRPVPAGATGELYIGGIGLARGYLNRPTLTAERFINWQPPVAPGEAKPPAERLYRSGDLARLRADGNLEFLGRIDDQVKLRGFRIELGEIEAALRRHPAVLDTVVQLREDEPGAPRLVAYLVLAEHSERAASVTRIELRTHLRASLPEHMIPTAFVELPRLPLNSNGKLDRAALPAPVAERRETGWGPPATADELMLGKLWAQALGRSHIRARDNFFDLGGHSLAAARAVTLVNTAFGCNLPLRLIYEAPTVATFAQSMRLGASQSAPPSALDLAVEATLDPAIHPRRRHRRAVQPGAIFLTGATGYLGAFLLAELLKRTEDTIHCLVRGSHQQEALARLAAIGELYQLPLAAATARIVPVLGDLRQPLLGLSQQAFRRLAETVGQIYHAGAQVHYLYPYTTLKAANVQGTTEVLRLASTGAAKPLHYVSSLATPLRASGRATIYEDDALGPCDSTRGYDQSKWVAEALVRDAGTRGLPVHIYRSGRLGSDSRTGVFNDADFFVRLLAGCLHLGQAPDLPLLENLLPVDYAARQIVGIAGHEPSPGVTTFHLLSPQHTSWRWVVEQSAARGYDLDLVPYDAWRLALEQAIASDPGHPLLSLLPYLPPDPADASWVDVLERYSFDASRTRSYLPAESWSGPWFEQRQLAALLAEGSRRGIFPAPGAQASAAEWAAPALAGTVA